MPTGVRSVGAADRARLRGVVPGELGLGWGTGRCKRCGLGGEAEAGEQAAGEVGIDDEGHDGAATAAGALQNVLGEDGDRRQRADQDAVRPGQQDHRHQAPRLTAAVLGPGWNAHRARVGRRPGEDPQPVHVRNEKNDTEGNDMEIVDDCSRAAETVIGHNPAYGTLNAKVNLDGETKEYETTLSR